MQQKYSNDEIVQLLQRDGEKAIEFLFGEYYAYLCRSALRILKDENLAEDLVQEVFYELWKKRSDLHISTSIKAYLRRATINKSLNYIRDHRKVHFEQEDRINMPSKGAGAVKRLEASELQQLIDQAIDRLPERCRIIFILSRFEDMTYKEISEQLGISIKTVENQISKALRLLRQALEPYLLHGLLVLAGLLL